MKKNKQPAHTPGGQGRLRSWSGPVETDFQGRLRFSYANGPASTSFLLATVKGRMIALLFDLEDYDTTYRATRDAYLKAANEPATGPYKTARDAYFAATATYTNYE